MSVEGNPNLEEQAESLIKMRTDLNELLGDDWKEKTLFQSFEDAFSKEEIEEIKNSHLVSKRVWLS